VIRVLVVDDHRLVRAGLITLLEAAGDIEVAGEAADGRQALEWPGTPRRTSP
jgi:DNA-binding NarL/FixJ family response regulator